MLYFLHVATA